MSSGASSIAEKRSQSRRGFLRMLGGWRGRDEARRAKSGVPRRSSTSEVGSSSPTSRRAAGLSRAVNVSGSRDNKRFLLEEMGCGVALFDYDNDGWLDIFLVNGSSFDPKVRDSKPSSYLFHNNRDGTFTDVTAKAGLTRSGWGQACCVGDYDNDGFDDLFVTYWGHNVLYHNNGDGTFTDVTAKAGVAGSGNVWGAGCSFLDYDRDGHLDLFVASYVNFDPAKAPQPGSVGVLPLQRHPGPLRAAGICRRHQHPLSQSRGRHIRGRLGSVGDRPSARACLDGVCRQQLAAHGLVRHGRGGGGFRQRRLAGHLRRLRQRAKSACIATTTTGPSARSRFPPAARSMRMELPCPAWASASAISTPTAGWTSSGRISPSRSPRSTATTEAPSPTPASRRASA